MLRHECMVGQTVTFRTRGSLWTGKITKVNPKNIKVTTWSPSAKQWNVHPSFLKLDDGTAPAAPPPGAASKEFVRGNVVKCSSIGTDLYVVLKKHGAGYHLAKLGGDRNLYYTGIDSELLELVNFELAGV